MKLDLHTHSHHSIDGHESPAQMVRQAMSKGLQGIAIADHNTIQGALEALAYVRENAIADFIVVPAVEVSSTEGHILAYGVTGDIPQKRTPAETVDLIHDAGGIAVASHPCRILGNNLSSRAVRAASFDALETFNARFVVPYGNARAAALCAELDLGQTGGSDAHCLDAIGAGITVFPEAGATADDLLDAIVKKRTHTQGARVPLGILAQERTRDFVEFIKRGMKRV